jgi:hypothetical protein
MDKYTEGIFFESVIKALKEEDKDLRTLFNSNSPLYSKQHNGIACLYETTIVYLVFKELMRNRFPLMVFWERPYPAPSLLKADMGLINEKNEIDALVEFKIWSSEDGREIRADVEKLLCLNHNCAKYICVVEFAGGNIADNRDYILAMNSELDIIRLEEINTELYNYKLKKLETRPVFVYLFKVDSR